jgi:hypothetical protein
MTKGTDRDWLRNFVHLTLIIPIQVEDKVTSVSE